MGQAPQAPDIQHQSPPAGNSKQSKAEKYIKESKRGFFLRLGVVGYLRIVEQKVLHGILDLNQHRKCMPKAQGS